MCPVGDSENGLLQEDDQRKRKLGHSKLYRDI
jgi:hypothetical protein